MGEVACVVRLSTPDVAADRIGENFVAQLRGKGRLVVDLPAADGESRRCASRRALATHSFLAPPPPITTEAGASSSRPPIACTRPAPPSRAARASLTPQAVRRAAGAAEVEKACLEAGLVPRPAKPVVGAALSAG